VRREPSAWRPSWTNTRIWGGLAALPAAARWAILSAVALLATLLIGAGVWSALERREASAQRALASAEAVYRQALASRQEASLAAAASKLEQFLKDYPRSTGAGQAWYLLGNVEYERRRFDAALAAYEKAAARSAGTVGTLSRLALGYAWEAKGDAARALDAYRAGLTDRGPKDFLYGEFLLAKARVEEQLTRRTEAIETYRSFLKAVPEAAQAEAVKSRLAAWGVSI
jgi:tetratricopeptide (TPR) repeat protein